MNEQDERLTDVVAKFRLGGTVNTTLAGRRQSAAKSVPKADLEFVNARPKKIDGQLNVKVTSEFVEMCRAMARAEGIPLAHLIVRAVEQYKTKGGQ